MFQVAPALKISDTTFIENPQFEIPDKVITCNLDEPCKIEGATISFWVTSAPIHTVSEQATIYPSNFETFIPEIRMVSTGSLPIPTYCVATATSIGFIIMGITQGSLVLIASGIALISTVGAALWETRKRI